MTLDPGPRPTPTLPSVVVDGSATGVNRNVFELDVHSFPEIRTRDTVCTP